MRHEPQKDINPGRDVNAPHHRGKHRLDTSKANCLMNGLDKVPVWLDRGTIGEAGTTGRGLDHDPIERRHRLCSTMCALVGRIDD